MYFYLPGAQPSTVEVEGTEPGGGRHQAVRGQQAPHLVIPHVEALQAGPGPARRPEDGLGLLHRQLGGEHHHRVLEGGDRGQQGGLAEGEESVFSCRVQ